MLKKSEVLDAGGFFFDYWHCTYVNRPQKMLFSHWYVEAHTAEELQEHIAHATPTGEWQFFCMSIPSDYVRNKVLERYA
jgi:hypothetical protein